VTETVVGIAVSAMALGSLYALLASGLSLIWSTLRVFNYAHGGLLILAAYIMWTLADRAGLPIILAFAVTIPLMALVGIVFELIAVRPFIRRPGGDLQIMVSTLAVAGIIEGGAQLAWGPMTKQLPATSQAVVSLAGVKVRVSQLIGLLVVLLLIGGLVALLQRTELGARIRAVEQNREMASLVGIRPARIYAVVIVIATTLATAAALVYGTISVITPAKGAAPLLTAFVVLVFGGTASLWGTLAGAFAIGLLEAATTYWIGLQWSPVAVLLVLVAVMLIRPEGLVKGRAA
jgi:branched-chain amino acid transport system permease protein